MSRTVRNVNWAKYVILIIIIVCELAFTISASTKSLTSDKAASFTYDRKRRVHTFVTLHVDNSQKKGKTGLCFRVKTKGRTVQKLQF